MEKHLREKQSRINWHNGFVSAMKLDLADNEKEVDPNMCQAVNELFADELKEMEQKMKLIIADKDAMIADQSAIIAKLQAQLEQYANNASNASEMKGTQKA